MDSYRNPAIRKQVSVFLPAGEWRTLRDEAARRRVSMAELCRRWLRPELDRAGRGPSGSHPSGRDRSPPSAAPGSDPDRRGPGGPSGRGRPG